MTATDKGYYGQEKLSEELGGLDKAGQAPHSEAQYDKEQNGRQPKTPGEPLGGYAYYEKGGNTYEDVFMHLACGKHESWKRSK